MPFLSIVMPVYGVEKYISAAIESVLCQTFQDWELIIVNDGTKDRSREIAQKYEAKDSRIHIIDKENGGLSDARNSGLKLASGEYIHFFDSDDYIEKSFYADFMKCITISKKDIYISGYIIEFHDNHEKSISHSIRKISYKSFSDFSNKELIYFLDSQFNYAWNKLFKTKFLKDNELFYKKGLYSIEDAEFMSRVIKYSPQIELCSYVGYHYIIRERVSLGRCYQREIVDFDASKLEIQKIIANFFFEDYSIVKEWLDRSCLTIYKFLFQSLFNYSEMMSMSERLIEIKYILNNKILNDAIRNTNKIPLYDNFLKYFIIHKSSFIIFVIYKYKSIINR